MQYICWACHYIFLVSILPPPGDSPDCPKCGHGGCEKYVDEFDDERYQYHLWE